MQKYTKFALLINHLKIILTPFYPGLKKHYLKELKIIEH